MKKRHQATRREKTEWVGGSERSAGSREKERERGCVIGRVRKRQEEAHGGVRVGGKERYKERGVCEWWGQRVGVHKRERLGGWKNGRVRGVYMRAWASERGGKERSERAKSRQGGRISVGKRVNGNLKNRGS